MSWFNPTKLSEERSTTASSPLVSVAAMAGDPAGVVANDTEEQTPTLPDEYVAATSAPAEVVTPHAGTADVVTAREEETPASDDPAPSGKEQVASEILTARPDRSRIITAAVMVCALAAGVFVAWPHEGRSLGASTPRAVTSNELAATTQAAAVPTPQQLASDDQVRAINMLATSGSLSGFTPAVGGEVFYGTYQTTAVFGRLMDDTCWVYAVASGRPTQVEQDPTGFGCSTAAIDQFAQRMRELS